MELAAEGAALERLKDAVETFKDDSWEFDQGASGLRTWGLVLEALAAAQEEQK
jgi:hypothetical protein